MVQNYSCGESVISLSHLRLESPFFIQKIIRKKEGSSISVVRLGPERIIVPETLRTKTHDQLDRVLLSTIMIIDPAAISSGTPLKNFFAFQKQI